MKKVTKLFALLLVLILLLCGCGVGQTTVPTEPQASTPTEALPTEPTEAEPTDPQPEDTEPAGELFEVTREGHYVFEEPSFDSVWVQGLPVGVYTIVDRAQDDEGLHWGKLKSGMGWICLDEIQQAQQAALPVAVVEAYPDLLKGDRADSVALFQDEYCWKVAVFAYENVTDVKLGILDVFAEDPSVVEVLWERDSLNPERPVVLELVFPGDFTTYELTFLDASGEARIFRIMQSGRNGVIFTSEVQ